MKFILA
jgi:hypothetical protein